MSGSGSNLQALIDGGDPDVELVTVLSDLPEAPALDRARRAGLPVDVVDWSGDRADFTERICQAAEDARAEALILAGFMRILAPSAISRFKDRILNVHPSLLPSFPGARPVESAIEAGVKVTGITVHFVDEFVDHGPIAAQRCLAVDGDDTAESLHRRLQVLEHETYPEVVGALARGELTVVDGRAIWT